MSLLRTAGERSGHPFGLSDCLARKFFQCFPHVHFILNVIVHHDRPEVQ